MRKPSDKCQRDFVHMQAEHKINLTTGQFILLTRVYPGTGNGAMASRLVPSP